MKLLFINQMPFSLEVNALGFYKLKYEMYILRVETLNVKEFITGVYVFPIFLAFRNETFHLNTSTLTSQNHNPRITNIYAK